MRERERDRAFTLVHGLVPLVAGEERERARECESNSPPVEHQSSIRLQGSTYRLRIFEAIQLVNYKIQ